jgi:GTPase KRas
VRAKVSFLSTRTTFERLEKFRQSMRRVKRGDPIFMFAGNKCDKISEQEVSREEGATLARQFGCEFLETSAKTAQNIERLFMNLIPSLRQTRNIEPGTPSQPMKKEKKSHTGKCVIM